MSGGLYGSLFSGVTGINVQGAAIGDISNNVSNINTVGYKTSKSSFSSLVTGGGSVGSSGGGAQARTRQAIDAQGLILPTGVSTDLAISGKGFFVVNDKDDGTGDTLYTRAGSFRTDNRGNLQNAAGYYLQAWPLDNEARLPGDLGNLNTTPNARIDSLQIVNTRGSTVAQATTKIEFGLNLNASETRLRGQGALITFPVATGDFNGGPTFTSTSVIVPGGATSGLATGDSFTVRVDGDTDYTFNYGGFAESTDVTLGILGATTETGSFTIGASDEGDILRIAAASIPGGTVDLTLSNSPDPLNGRFDSLATLAEAINNTTGLTARISNNMLYISSRDANDAITFTDVDGPNGGGAAAIKAGLGVVDVVAGLDRFNTLDGLKNVVATKPGLGAVIESTTNDPQMTIYAQDPLATIEFLDVPANNFIGAGDEFGIAIGALDPVYAALNSGGGNMASGTISPQFSRNVRIFDGLGVGHDFRYSAVKIDNNQWAVELYAADPSEIISSRNDGLVADGNITFNGDGSLRNLSSGLLGDIEISWANEAKISTVQLDFGTPGQPLGTVGATEIGLTDGLTQFDGSYDVRFVDQNGAGAGLLTSVSVDKDGFLFFNYSNGESRKIYKIPLADFPNMNGLTATSGNAYTQGDDSGDFTLKQAGSSGVGVFSPESLENSGTELSGELTDLIVAQRSYESNTKIITTADSLLKTLTDMLR